LIEAGRMKLKEAAEKIGMSYQQTKRIYQFPPLFSLMNRSVYNKGNFAPDRRTAAQSARFSNPIMPSVNL